MEKRGARGWWRVAEWAGDRRRAVMDWPVARRAVCRSVGLICRREAERDLHEVRSGSRSRTDDFMLLGLGLSFSLLLSLSPSLPRDSLSLLVALHAVLNILAFSDLDCVLTFFLFL